VSVGRQVEIVGRFYTKQVEGNEWNSVKPAFFSTYLNNEGRRCLSDLWIAS
jgi:hypothetical protein